MTVRERISAFPLHSARSRPWRCPQRAGHDRYYSPAWLSAARGQSVPCVLPAAAAPTEKPKHPQWSDKASAWRDVLLPIKGPDPCQENFSCLVSIIAKLGKFGLQIGRRAVHICLAALPQPFQIIKIFLIIVEPYCLP